MTFRFDDEGSIRRKKLSAENLAAEIMSVRYVGQRWFPFQEQTRFEVFSTFLGRTLTRHPDLKQTRHLNNCVAHLRLIETPGMSGVIPPVIFIPLSSP